MGGGEKGTKRAASKERPVLDNNNKMRKIGRQEEFVVLYKTKQGDAGFRAVNPIKISGALGSQIGNGFQATILANGVLRIFCKDEKQNNEAKKVEKLVVSVECIIPRGKQGLKGVVYGVYSGLTEKEILDNVKPRGLVTDVRRFKPRVGVEGGPPVQITFNNDMLPERVFIGSLAYRVKEYIRPPLRCFNCQRFGHVAGSCRGKRKCAKCGGDHAIQECKAEDPKCPNCGESHAAAFRGCRYFVQAKQVQKVRDQEKISYVEAVKQVTGVRQVGEVNVNRNVVQGVPRVKPSLSVYPPNMIILKRESFLAFMADVWLEPKKQ